jgi:hypothetical protein
VHAAPRELPKFLDEVEQNLPANLDIHVVMDNAATHRTKLIRVWFAKRRRWHIHFTPTSWINQVERFFALPAEQQIKRAVSMDQTSRRHFRFVGTLSSSDDQQPSRTDSIVLAILASPFKSKLRTEILVDVHPVSPRKTEARKPQRPWFGPDGQPPESPHLELTWPRRSFARGYDTPVPWIKMRDTNYESRDHELRRLRCPPPGLQI